MGGLFAELAPLAMIGLYLGAGLGWLWWMWLAIQVGSFGMLVFGLLGPCPALLGLWSLFFGMPLWLLHLLHVTPS